MKNTILSAIKGFFPHFATPAMLAAGLFFGAKFVAKSEVTQFDDAEQKIETIQHVESAPNEVDNYKAYQHLDTITKAHKRNSHNAIASRAKRDSLTKRNTVTIYQMKQDINKILTKLDSIK